MCDNFILLLTVLIKNRFNVFYLLLAFRFVRGLKNLNIMKIDELLEKLEQGECVTIPTTNAYMRLFHKTVSTRYSRFSMTISTENNQTTFEPVYMDLSALANES